MWQPRRHNARVLPSQHPCICHRCCTAVALSLLKTQPPHLSEPGVFLAFPWLWRCMLSSFPRCEAIGDKTKIRYQHVCQLSTIPSVCTDKSRLTSLPRYFFHQAQSDALKKGSVIKLAAASSKIKCVKCWAQRRGKHSEPQFGFDLRCVDIRLSSKAVQRWATLFISNEFWLRTEPINTWTDIQGKLDIKKYLFFILFLCRFFISVYFTWKY